MNLVNRINIFNKLAQENELTNLINNLSRFEKLSIQEFLLSINEIINILKIKLNISYNGELSSSINNLRDYLYNTLISYQTGKDNKEDMLTSGFELFKTTLNYIRKYLSKQSNYGVVPLSKSTNNTYNQSWDVKV